MSWTRRSVAVLFASSTVALVTIGACGDDPGTDGDGASVDATASSGGASGHDATSGGDDAKAGNNDGAAGGDDVSTILDASEDSDDGSTLFDAGHDGGDASVVFDAAGDVTADGSTATDGSDGSDDGSTVGDAGSTSDAQALDDAPPGDSSPSVDSSCAQTIVEAVLAPIDMYVMLDQSGSMGSDCNVGSTTSSKWCNAINALSAYFKSSASTGHAAALQYFALSNPIQCNGAGYDVSAVPGGDGYVSLPSNAFDSNLNSHTPSTNTPHEAAIRGIIGFTGRPINRRPGRTPIGILITDGDPCCGECNESISSLRGLLQTHFNNTGIRTFVIGMTGANFNNLEQYAIGGNGPLHNDSVNSIADTCGNGSGPCRHWNVGSGASSVFVEALKSIQAAAVGCAHPMPTTDAGVVNPDAAQIEYMPNGQPPPQQLTRVSGAAQCVPDGWYYDNNTTPTMINLCPSICSTVQGDANAKLKVLLYCVGG
jgi:hypothetical protein